MVLLANEACGGNADDALGAACAVEMIHTYSLVHDDLPAMDDDALRRGRPTCHLQFDEATAILVGDALLTQAFEVLATEVRPAETAVRCLKVLATAAGACHLIGGQSADLAAENGVLTIDELVAIHVRKTASLFSAAAYLGGATAGADADRAGRLSEFGRLFGLSFQIIDDLLDVHGSPGDVGKQTQKDRGRGKATYPQLVGDAASRTRADELVEQALSLLEPFGRGAAGLRDLVQQMVHRNK
jgi:geranylgeranyl diphosphate synthase type II